MHPLVNFIKKQLQNHFPAEDALQLSLNVTQEITRLSTTQLLLATSDNTKLTLPQNINNIISRIISGEPLPYITNTMEWMDLTLHIQPSVLIPRIETADLVSWILNNHKNKKSINVLDIGTGSGCIAIKLKKEHPNWSIIAIDISLDALQVATINAKMNNTTIHFYHYDIFTSPIPPLQNQFDIIVSNPPYIRPCDYIEERVAKFEPHQALFVPQNNPMLFYKRIAELKMGKWIYFETNELLTNQVADILKNETYDSIQIAKDLFGKKRMVSGRIAL